MSLLFYSAHDDISAWTAELRSQVTDMPVRIWPDLPDPAEVTHALVWKPPRGLLAGLPNLKVIFSLGAGVDSLLADPTLPDLPLVRMVEPGLTEGMTDYVCWQVLHWLRQGPHYRDAQAKGVWSPMLRQPLARDVGVGILGLGQLGTDAALALKALRFDVAGWSRSPKDVPGIACFHGGEQLAPFLARSRILVCLLPLTPDTDGLLDRARLSQLPEGAVLINAARGRLVVEADLLDALESGRLAGATLDVFQTEPLPRNHPFWSHPRVVITPHVAAITQPRTAVAEVVRGIRDHRDGRPLAHLVDRSRGY